MTDVAPTISAILGLPAPAQTTGTAISSMVPGRRVGRVAVLATDALGEYAWGLWGSEMPFLQSLHARQSIILRSVMPSITPVNFATMVTGTDLAGHGVHTYDHDFACETLFDVVRRNGEKSAGIGIDGYTGSKLLGRFADLQGTVKEHSDDAVADAIVEVVDRHAPQFLIAQLGCVDDVFHLHGPSSPEVVPMLRETDARLKRLVKHLQPRGYGILILSDHGQHDLPDPAPGGKKGSHGTDSPQDCLVPCTWAWPVEPEGRR